MTPISISENINKILNILQNLNTVGAATTPTTSNCACNSSTCNFMFDTVDEVVNRVKCKRACVQASPCERCLVPTSYGGRDPKMCFYCGQTGAPPCKCSDMGNKVYETRTECEEREGKKCTWKDFSESASVCCDSVVKCAVPCEGQIKPCECLTDCEKESTQEDCEAKSGKKCKPFKCASFFGQCCDDNNSCWEPCDDQESLEPCACDNLICRLYPTQEECEEIEQYACIRATCEAGSETDCCKANSDCWEPCINPTGQSCICGEGNCLDMFETKEICEQNVSPKRCIKTGKCLGSAEDCCTEASCWQEAPICQCSDYGLLTKTECEAKAFPNFDKYCQKESVGRGAPECNENSECYVFVKPTNLCTACFDTYDTLPECEFERAGRFDRDRWECRTGYSCAAGDSLAVDCVALVVNYSATVSFTFSTTITMTFPDCDCADCASTGDEIFYSLNECNSYLRTNLEDRWKKCVNFSCARSSQGFCNVNSECARTELRCDPPPLPGRTCDDCNYGPNEFPATEEGRRSCELNAQQTIGSKWSCCYSCEKANTQSTNDADNCLCYRLIAKDFGEDSQSQCCEKCCGIPGDQFFRNDQDCKNARPMSCDSRDDLEWVCSPADCGGCCQNQCIRGICQTPQQTCSQGCPSDLNLMDFDACETQRRNSPVLAECKPKSCSALPLAKCYSLEIVLTPTSTTCSCNEVNSRCLNAVECDRIASGPLCPARAPNICVCRESQECSKPCPNSQPNPGDCVKLEEVTVDCNSFAQVCRGDDGKSYNAATGECERQREQMRRNFPNYIWACEGCTEVGSYQGRDVEVKCEKLVSSPDRCCAYGRGNDCLTLGECSHRNAQRCSNSCLGPKCRDSCRVSKRKPCPPVSSVDRCEGRYWDCAENALEDCERCQDFKSCLVFHQLPGGGRSICTCDTHNTTGSVCPPGRPPC